MTTLAWEEIEDRAAEFRKKWSAEKDAEKVQKQRKQLYFSVLLLRMYIQVRLIHTKTCLDIWALKMQVLSLLLVMKMVPVQNSMKSVTWQKASNHRISLSLRTYTIDKKWPYVPHPLAGVMAQNKSANARKKQVWSIGTQNLKTTNHR